MPSNERGPQSVPMPSLGRDRKKSAWLRPKRRVMLTDPATGRRYKDPFARIAARIPIDPVFEADWKSDLFYDPAQIMFGQGFVYLLRFSQPLRGTVKLANCGGIMYTAKAASYYLGYADNFEAFLSRMYVHTSRADGTGTAAIIRECHKRGITFTLARFWIQLSKDAEKAFKRRLSFARLDPAHNPRWRNVPSGEWLKPFQMERRFWKSDETPEDGLPF